MTEGAAARKIIAQVAVSADGFIARPDGSVDWLNRPRTSGDYGMKEFYGSIDTILWGRKTYEVALEFQRQGIPGAAFDPNVANYAFSRSPPESVAPGVEFVTGPIEDFARRLRGASGKNVWIMGGAELIGSFLDAGEIDELALHVIPVLIGEGIPLLSPRHREVELDLRDCTHFPDGVVGLHYDISR